MNYTASDSIFKYNIFTLVRSNLGNLMALSQVQIIQSLAEALLWYEKEIEWRVSSGELNHLTGRIGELYAAMITRGQMALETNQRGYDVISASNERISVKTITSSNHVAFNPNTFDLVDRVMILRLNTDDDDEGLSVEILLDCGAEDFKKEHETSSGKMTYYISKSGAPIRPLENLKIVDKKEFEKHTIFRYENGTIKVSVDDVIQSVTKPHLREVAQKIGVNILNDQGNTKNVRQLGAHIIRALVS